MEWLAVQRRSKSSDGSGVSNRPIARVDPILTGMRERYTVGVLQ